MNIDNEKMCKIMKLVMEEVDISVQEGNSPFAAFLLDMDGNIKYKAHNTSNTGFDPTAHAEINLIRKASKDLKTKDLSDYVLISNAWSCSMCFSAAIKAKITNYIFGAESESKMNPLITIFDIKDKCNSGLNITTGILKEECKVQIENARRILKDKK